MDKPSIPTSSILYSSSNDVNKLDVAKGHQSTDTISTGYTMNSSTEVPHKITMMYLIYDATDIGSTVPKIQSMQCVNTVVLKTEAGKNKSDVPVQSGDETTENLETVCSSHNKLPEPVARYIRETNQNADTDTNGNPDSSVEPYNRDTDKNGKAATNENPESQVELHNRDTNKTIEMDTIGNIDSSCLSDGGLMSGASTSSGCERNVNTPAAPETSYCGFTCTKCTKTFPNLKSLLQHSLIHRRTYTGTMFRERNTYKGKKYKCNDCWRSYDKPMSLKQHRLVHTGEDPYKCLVCNAVRTKKSFHDHTILHREFDAYECSLCGKRFHQILKLNLHMRSVHGGDSKDNPFMCKFCKKEFRRLSEARKHEKDYHLKEKSILCHVCGKTFFDVARLKYHSQIHDSVKAHECKICNKRFSQKKPLQTHMISHSGEKPHMCDVCGKKFGIRANMRTHRKIHLKKAHLMSSVCSRANTTHDPNMTE